MAARKFLPRCTAFELQIFNDSIGIRLKNAVHLGKKFLAAIFSAIVYSENQGAPKAREGKRPVERIDQCVMHMQTRQRQNLT